jgi:hypothetical protein
MPRFRGPRLPLPGPHQTQPCIRGPVAICSESCAQFWQFAPRGDGASAAVSGEKCPLLRAEAQTRLFFRRAFVCPGTHSPLAGLRLEVLNRLLLGRGESYLLIGILKPFVVNRMRDPGRLCRGNHASSALISRAKCLLLRTQLALFFRSLLFSTRTFTHRMTKTSGKRSRALRRWCDSAIMAARR